MSKIEIPGFKRYDHENQCEPCESDKRLMLSEVKQCVAEDIYPAECMLAWSGNTMFLAVKNKRSGRVEYYEVQPRAHWIPTPGYEALNSQSAAELIASERSCESCDGTGMIKVPESEPGRFGKATHLSCAVCGGNGKQFK